MGAGAFAPAVDSFSRRPSVSAWAAVLDSHCFLLLSIFTLHFALSLSVCIGILPSWKTRWIFSVAEKIRDIRTSAVILIFQF